MQLIGVVEIGNCMFKFPLWLRIVCGYSAHRGVIPRRAVQQQRRVSGLHTGSVARGVKFNVAFVNR